MRGWIGRSSHLSNRGEASLNNVGQCILSWLGLFLLSLPASNCVRWVYFRGHDFTWTTQHNGVEVLRLQSAVSFFSGCASTACSMLPTENGIVCV